MHTIKNMRYAASCLVLCTLSFLLAACSQKKAERHYTQADLKDVRVAVTIGSIQDKFFMENYPGKELIRANAAPDLPLMLKEHETDVIALGAVDYSLCKKVLPNMYVITDSLQPTPVCAAFNKDNEELREEFDRFLAELKKDGTLEKIRRYWLVDDDGTYPMPSDIPVYTSGKPLRYAIVGRNLGYNFYRNNEPMGMEVELVKRFAAREKRPVEYSVIEFSGLIAALVSHKVDIVASYLCKTPERAKAVAFSEPYSITHTICIAIDETADADAANASWLEGIKESFVNNLIKEDRYLLILKGLWTTVLISVCSAVLGTLLGGLVCWMRMSRRKVCSGFAKCYITLMRGIPILVFLMLMYYVFLAKLNIGGVAVAVIAFAMNFAAYVSEMFRTSIEGVDHGQTEAGIAMGFTPVQTFVHIVMPQAVRSVLPVYKGELIGLVKSTSVVGYIAVEDLTKASDLIRSRTFDAFFPLIISALLYFALAWLLAALMERGIKARRKM